MTNLEKSYLRFDKRGISIFVGCKKMVEIWEKMFLEKADAHAPIRTRRGKKQKIPLDYHWAEGADNRSKQTEKAGYINKTAIYLG